MTPIQEASLPAILQGQDVRAKAKTGSGKTAAFGIGLLNSITVSQFVAQALVLCPTRELADQVSKELRRLARFTQNIKILTLCGGQAIGPQLESLVHPPHIVVGTPGQMVVQVRLSEFAGAAETVRAEATAAMRMVENCILRGWWLLIMDVVRGVEFDVERC